MFLKIVRETFGFHLHVKNTFGVVPRVVLIAVNNVSSTLNLAPIRV
jgi:hypothetical protein